MKLFVIKERALTNQELDLISDQSRKFIHLGTLNREILKKFQKVNKFYIAELNGELAGFCMVVKVGKWYKIGPVVILEKFQNKGFGTKLLTEIVHRNSDNNLYIGSSNTKVCQIALNLGFTEVFSYWQLPSEIKFYIVKYFWERLNPEFMIDALQKKIRSKSRYRYFLRLSG